MFVKKLPLEYQQVFKTYLPTYLWDSSDSDSRDSWDSSNSSDNSDGSDSSDSSDQKKTFSKKKLLS